MNPVKLLSRLLLLSLLLSALSAAAQERRWLLSANPLGLLEFRAALGLGAGVKFSPKTELWMETSRLTDGVWSRKGAAGIRQILQFKYFPFASRRVEGFFIAVEGRYVSYEYSDHKNYVNPATGLQLNEYHIRAHRWFWGGGMQYGYRQFLDGAGRFAIETEIGLALKHRGYEEEGVPPGYLPPADNGTRNRLSEVPDINFRNKDLYFPGSIRLVWTMGRKFSSGK